MEAAKKQGPCPSETESALASAPGRQPGPAGRPDFAELGGCPKFSLMAWSAYITPALVVASTVFLWRVPGQRIDDTNRRLDAIERQPGELCGWIVAHLEHHKEYDKA